MCLIGTIEAAGLPHMLLVILQVAVGLGAVIFVHELGHFTVAKLCGVKCEKFFIGFDIGGYKLSRKWGETEYGIGVLPLGGYVKMLGQDDNPANIAEQVRESEIRGSLAEGKEIIGPDGKAYLVDRRSYLAKSVPQRMAIISAGVVMNVIFAFIFAVVAYKLGVPYNPSVVSQTAPGSPAWQADIRPGDEVVQLGELKNPSFAEMRGGVTLGDLERGISFVIERNGEKIDKMLKPLQGTGLPRVGIAAPESLRLNHQEPVEGDSPAARAKLAFEGGDEVIAVDGQPVSGYGEYSAAMAQKPDKTVVIRVRRGGTTSKGDPSGPLIGGETVDIEVGPRPMTWLGLVMHMGQIVAVQDNSPAAKASIQPGGIIERVAYASDNPQAGGRLGSAFDPMTLPDELRRVADEGREVRLEGRGLAAPRGEGRQQTDAVVVSLRKVDRDEMAIAANDPVAIPALGVAYRVLSVVDRVAPGSAAEKAGLETGDVVTEAAFVYPEGLKTKPKTKPIQFSQEEKDEHSNWPALMSTLQWQPPGTQVKLSYKRGDEVREAVLSPEVDEGYFVPQRGLQFDPIERVRIADTWGEAVNRGWEETVSSLSMVYRFLGKLGRQVPFSELGGPLTIAQAAGFSASEGLGKLLVFLTMLSANLAVINFLPIPVLDGGHMVFLAWEGVRGRPAGERVAVALQTVGIVFIITLMLFVLSLDVRRLFFA